MNPIVALSPLESAAANLERTMARKKHVKASAAKNAKLIADQAMGLAEYAAKALVAVGP